MKQSSKTALGGIAAAVSVAIMFILSVIPFMTYATPAVAGALIIFITIELDRKWAFGVFAAVGLLSLMLVPDKEIAVLYAAFFGYYPIIKSILESRLRSKALEVVIKLLIFNISVIASYILMIKFMGITIDESEMLGKFVIPLLLGLGNIVFIMYDFALTRLISAYLYKWQKYFKKIFK